MLAQALRQSRKKTWVQLPVMLQFAAQKNNLTNLG